MHNLIVIARYKEDLTWTNTLKTPFLVYNKGEYLEGAINVPNIGRESGTMMLYIIENYDRLPDNVTFLQGNPFYHCKDVKEFVDSYKENGDLVYLSDFIPIDDINGEPNHKGLPIRKFLIDLGLNSYQLFEFSAGAQYVVPKSLILSKSLDWWKKAYRIHQENTIAPWVFERIWPVIWAHKSN
jgi:hypothetical protein